MFNRLTILLILLSSFAFCQKNVGNLPQLSVSNDGHYIVNENGNTFFWLGDTAWELFYHLTQSEAEYYLKNRAEKGYNVVQSVLIASFDKPEQTDQQGNLPLVNNDPTRPNEAFFKSADKMINTANQLGIYVALLPTWGDRFNKKSEGGPEIFTVENAAIYGEFLGKRYKNKGIIWVLGGDRNPENDLHKEIIRSMAAGIRKAVGNTQLITYHPAGTSYSSKYFHEEKWLDFNMFQSGHDLKNRKNYLTVLADYKLLPTKPTLDGEPRYEDHPINWKAELGFFNDFDTRQAAWWAMLSGACGHTYGAHAVWQFLDFEKNPPLGLARTDWKRSLDLPGAYQMGFMKKLFERFTWQTLLPDQSLILNENPEDGGYQIAAMSREKNLGIIYSPYGRPLSIDLARFSNASLIAYWFNPRDGSQVNIGSLTNKGSQTFKPYVAGPETDWVLVITSEKTDAR